MLITLLCTLLRKSSFLSTKVGWEKLADFLDYLKLKIEILAETLPYPKYTLPAELVLLFVITGVEAIRNFFGKLIENANLSTFKLIFKINKNLGQKGNLSEQMASVVISIALTVPVFLSVLYFLLWQTYVLRLELILSAFQLGFLVLELIFGIVAIATFAR